VWKVDLKKYNIVIYKQLNNSKMEKEFSAVVWSDDQLRMIIKDGKTDEFCELAWGELKSRHMFASSEEGFPVYYFIEDDLKFIAEYSKKESIADEAFKMLKESILNKSFSIYKHECKCNKEAFYVRVVASTLWKHFVERGRTEKIREEAKGYIYDITEFLDVE